MGNIIYKIVASTALAGAEEDGVLEHSADDRRDGFVHFSTADQLAETLERHFDGAPHLMLLAFDAEALGEALRWEPSRGGALFPHLYASASLAAMLWAEPLPMAADGSHPLSDKLMTRIGAGS